MMSRLQAALSDQTFVLRLILAVMAVALVYRLWPVAAGMPALAQFFVTEDGYLMLTVARNLAIGLGLSVSEGTIPTNGVQPLATLIYAVPYAVTGGDKVTSLLGLHLIWATIAVAGALAIKALATRVLVPLGLAPVWSWLVAALWFSGPLLLRHSMNALETGLYTLLIVLACLQFMRVIERGPAVGTRDLVLMAVVLGLVFLGRNDGIFLVVALASVYLVNALVVWRLGAGALARHLALPALVCATVVAPWLIHNQLFFGSIIPISGPAQSLTAAFGANAALLPAVLFEQLFPMLPLPGRIETMLPVMIVTSLSILAATGHFVRRAWIAGGAVRLVVVGYLLHALAISAYYGFFFGAAHFMPRYTAPLAPFFIMALVTVGWDLAQRFGPQRAGAVMGGMATAGLVLSLALLGRLLLPSVAVQGHFQVVDWVDRNVPAETWVGAIQTGTLGYWHDRTINLDGKVNPAALQARRERGHVLDYVVASEITYLADWPGIAGWVDHGAFGTYFEVFVYDRAGVLAVLRRR